VCVCTCCAPVNSNIAMFVGGRLSSNLSGQVPGQMRSARVTFCVETFVARLGGREHVATVTWRVWRVLSARQ
jgi:hypothetical protein